MKTVFITVAESSVANNLLRGDFLRILAGDKLLRIILIVPEEKATLYAEEFGAERILVETYRSTERSFRERLNNFFARNTLATDMVHLLQMRQYKDDKKILLYFLKRILCMFFGDSRLFQTTVRRHEMTLSTPARVRELFAEYRPDLVFAAVANYIEMDVLFLREARRRGIKTAGMMRGWDAFAAHGFLRVVPDVLFLQNEYMRASGRAYQSLPERAMRVVGSPAFDWYFRAYLLKSRDEFFKSIGADPKKRLILFGAMEYYWYPRDADIVALFNSLVEAGEIPKDVVMLFRPHPGYEGPVERVKGLSHVIPDMVSFTTAHGDSVEMREKQVSHLLNSIFHSSLVISVASTIALDGVALGKPALSVAFEEGALPYWESIARFHTHDTHFIDAFSTGGIPRAWSKEEFVLLVNRYLSDPSQDVDKRRILRNRFIEPFDGRAGERMARAILEELGAY